MADFIIFGLLFLYFFLEIYLFHRKTLEWHGENSMLKIPRTYHAKFFSLFDIFQVLMFLMGIFGIIISLNLENDFKVIAIMCILSLALMCIPTFYFYIKYQYWQQNGGNSYTFDPILRKITIEGNISQEISFDEIKKIIIYYPRNYKLVSGGYNKIVLGKTKVIYLTSLLPCYGILEEFFKDVKKQAIHKRIFKISNV